ncbi:MAG: hypothetical protein RBT60_03050 [Candidatus Krumholzibacteria bacterium]|nr:hypothetical protein [Candidatus Krumholzibacteria bacterium]
MKSSVMRSALGGLLVLSLVLVFSSCSNHDGNDWQRLVCDVQSTNGGNPLVAPFLTISSGDTLVALTTAGFVFHARPYGSTIMLPEDAAHSWFQITHYDLLWENVPEIYDDYGVDLTQHNVIGGSTNIMVPVYEEAGASLIIVGWDMKYSEWFIRLGVLYEIPPFQANVRVIFYGHESGSDKVVDIETSLRVMFVDSVVAN